MIEFQFAGEKREFALKPSRYSRFAKEAGFDSIGTLAELFKKSSTLSFTDSEVRHLLAHALAGPDNPVKLMKMRELVDEEMDGKPLAPFLALASLLVSDALSPEELKADGNQVDQ